MEYNLVIYQVGKVFRIKFKLVCREHSRQLMKFSKDGNVLGFVEKVNEDRLSECEHELTVINTLMIWKDAKLESKYLDFLFTHSLTHRFCCLTH